MKVTNRINCANLILAACLLPSLLLGGCSGIASGLSTLDSPAASPTVTSTGATGTTVYGGKEIGYYYKGQYAAVVQKLLNGAPAWRTPQVDNAAGIAAAQFPTFSNLATYGQRDQYIAAAILEAFEVETYARLGTPSKADLAAPAMMANLKSANGLCSNSPGTVQGTPPATLYITCQWLSSLTYP